MGIGTSIFLIAVGAILKYAVTRDVSGVNLDTVGVILMVVGAIGLLLSLLWARRTTTTTATPIVTSPRRETVVTERDVI